MPQWSCWATECVETQRGTCRAGAVSIVVWLYPCVQLMVLFFASVGSSISWFRVAIKEGHAGQAAF